MRWRWRPAYGPCWHACCAARRKPAVCPPADLDVDLECLRLSALLDGLNLRAMLEPEYATPEAQRAVLRRHLQGLKAG